MSLATRRTLAAFALVAGALAVPSAHAALPVAAPRAGKTLTPVRIPLGVGNRDVTVMVQLAGDPVALQQASAGRKLARDEKEAIKGQLKAAQVELHGNIEKMGGKVVAEFQSAYNGIKVQIARDKLATLAILPGVIAVRPVQLVKPSNVHGIPLIGAPNVWSNPGLHGEGIKIAIIDTGIDYTHANFGGPGTVAAYTTAHANETLPADPSLFGPAAPRVKGGTDLVGDSYDADPNSPTYQPVAHPDPNPLDCDGHGSHVAGTAAGSGVTAAGKTYPGPYNMTTVASNSWTIGPGVAPKADIYAIRVFGCTGSTDVVTDAIDWAVDHEMDVISMSLGSPFGTKDDPDAVAATNAAKAGIVVVAAAGNESPNPYTVGTPGTGDGVIAVAANDPNTTFPGASLSLSVTKDTVVAINANNAPFANSTVWPIAVLRESYPGGAIGLGCTQAEYAAYPGFPASLVGKVIVTLRGTCSRVARAIYAQQNGAAAALMINTDTTYPPFEGPITSSEETGPYNVTIPFLGVQGLVTTTGTDGAKVLVNDGGNATATNTTLTNPDYLGLADFTSGGPRSADSFLKPDITAPGVSITSTLSGSGNGATTLSGTSMATPHVSGSAVLTVQAHPDWTGEDLKAAIVNTGTPSLVNGYQISLGGTGLVQPVGSTATQVVAHGDSDKFAVAVNFGFAELAADFSATKTITLDNNGTVPAMFQVSIDHASGSPHIVGLDKTTVNVPPHGSATVKVTLKVPVASAGSSTAFREVAGLVTFTPGGPGAAPAPTPTPVSASAQILHVPYYFVPRALSNVATAIGSLAGKNPSTSARVTNRNGAIAGDADFYAWGLEDNKDPGKTSNDVRAVGVQSFPADATTQLMVFAVNTFDRWSNASTNEFDIYVDVDGDGTDDYIIVGADSGATEAGDPNGIMGAYVFSTRSATVTSNFLATAPTDSSTALLPVLSSQLCLPSEPCLTAKKPRITYHAVAFDLIGGGEDDVKGSAQFNVWNSAISTGGFVTVAPNKSDSTTTIAVDTSEWKNTPAKGLMVVTFDNQSGPGEAQLIPVDVK